MCRYIPLTRPQEYALSKYISVKTVILNEKMPLKKDNW